MTTVTPERYQMAALKAGLKLYRNTGIKPNRAWTPSAMMRTAARLTGKKFSSRDYTGAIEALEEALAK